MIRLFTIGVYGKSKEEFHAALKKANIDTFCDIRRRRNVRGHEYAYANSGHLQEDLKNEGITYYHFIDLSPSEELIQAQGMEDAHEHIARRERSHLAPDFIEGYRQSVLKSFNAASFIESLGRDARNVVLMCVEHNAPACHRSLLAEAISREIRGIEVVNL